MWNGSAPVVVGVDGSEAAVAATIWAIDEAASRDVPLRIVHGRFPDVRVYSVKPRTDISQFLSENKDEPVQLAVVAAEALQVVQIVRPHARTLTGHGACSLLVVR